MISIWRKILERFALNAFVGGDFAHAEQYFLRLKQDDPDRLGADHNLGLAQLGQDKFAEAEMSFRRDVQLFGESYLRARTLGDLYYLWGKGSEAAAWYKAALAQCDEECDATLLRRRIEISASPESLQHAQESYRVFGEGVEAQRNRNFHKARGSFDEAVRLDPTNFHAWNNLGSLYMDQDKDYAQARRCFETARSFSSLPMIVRNLEQARQRCNEEN